MVYDYFDKFTFLCEMYDEETDSIKELALNYFPYDNSVQVLDTNKGKLLVKRTQLPNINFKMLKIGNIINVFGKLLSLVDCEPATRKKLFKGYKSTFALIKPMPPSQYGKIVTYIMRKGFQIKNLKNFKLDKDTAGMLYRHISGSKSMPFVVNYVMSGEVIGLELVAENSVNYFRKCLGVTDPAEAEPGTLRRMFGESILKNAVHGSPTETDANDMCELFFGFENGVPKVPFQATLQNCTCCVVLPHVLDDGNLGLILEQIIQSGKFYISAMAMFSVRLADAKEFYEIYKGVLPVYEDMAIHLAEGRCVALEIKGVDPNIEIVKEFKKLCGPRDPDMCRQLYPDSIRALYGKDYIHNAVHCTELPEDGELEVEYFFKLLVLQ